MFSYDDKTEIRFKVKPRVRDNFDLALQLLNKSEEEAFEEFTSVLIAQALRKGEAMGTIMITGEEDVLSEEVIVGRIHKWFKNPNGYPYKMLKAFLTVSHHMNRDIDEPVDRFKMAGYFEAFANCDETKFESILRQMCSASKRAYGDVFRYERSTRQVSLNKKYIEVVRSLVDPDDYLE